MSYAPSTLADCPDIQAELTNYYETCNAARLREPMPFFDFLMSDINQSGYSQLVAPGGAKLKTVVMRYDQRIVETDASSPDGSAMACTSTKKRGDLTHSCTIDPVTDTRQVDELMTAADFMNACRSNDMIVGSKIQAMIDALVRSINKKLVIEAKALLGGWNADVSPTVSEGGFDFLKVNTLKASSTDINPSAFEDVDFAVEQSMWCNNPVIFSGATFYKYARTMNAGCCSAQGIDLSAIMNQYGKAVLYDRAINKNTSANYAWALRPGSLQVVTWNLNDNGINEAASGVQWGANYFKTIIRDPQSGLPIDLTVSDNCGNVSVIVRATAKICSIPDDLYNPADPQAGVTGFAGIKVVNT